MRLINDDLMNTLDGHQLLKLKLTEFLHQQFPQFNEKTKIQKVERPEILIDYVPDGSALRMMSEPLPIKGWKARLWRTIGELFNKQKWRSKGIRYIELPAPTVFRRSVHCNPFGASMMHNSPVMRNFMEEVIQIDCAYDRITDTLYIYRYYDDMREVGKGK